jgi:hypothetical protein
MKNSRQKARMLAEIVRGFRLRGIPRRRCNATGKSWLRVRKQEQKKLSPGAIRTRSACDKHHLHLWIRERAADKDTVGAQDLAHIAIIVLKNIELLEKKYFHKVLACSGDVYYYITKSPKHRGDD